MGVGLNKRGECQTEHEKTHLLLDYLWFMVNSLFLFPLLN